MQNDQLRQPQKHWVDTPNQLLAAPCGLVACYLVFSLRC